MDLTECPKIMPLQSESQAKEPIPDPPSHSINSTTIGLQSEAATFNSSVVFNVNPTIVSNQNGDNWKTLAFLFERHNAAFHLSHNGHYKEALEIYTQVYENRVKLLGPNDIDTLATRHDMAYVLRNLGRTEQALKIYNEVYTNRARVLGRLHHDTLTTRHDTAYLNYLEGKYEEAMRIFEEVHRDRSKILGEDHPDTLVTLKDLEEVKSLVENLGNEEDTDL